MSADAKSYESVIAEEVRERHQDAHFRVVTNCDGPLVDTLVRIDRNLGLFHVKPVGGRVWRTLPLSQVASMVYARAVKEDMGMRRGK